jgi:flagellar basal body-associated protein FliL
MVRTGHVSDAVNVLKSYAEVAGLPKVVEALEPFTDRTDDDVKHAVEILIEVLEQNEQLKRELSAQAEQLRIAEEARTAAPPEPPPATPEPEAAHTEEPADEADSENLTFLQLESEEQEDPDAASAEESEPVVVHGSDNIFVEEPEPTVVHGYEPVAPEETEPEAHEGPESAEANEMAPAAAAPADGEQVDAEDPAYKEYAPDSWPKKDGEAEPATKAKSRSKLAWVALILIVLVGGGAGLVYFEVVPLDMLGLGGVFAPADNPTPPGPTIPAADTSAQATADAVAEAEPTPQPPRQTTTTAAAQTPAPPPDTAATETAAQDTTAAAAPPESLTVAADTAQAAAVPVAQPPVIVVDGLRIVSVDPYSSGGLTGSTIVQILDTGERLTLTVLPASDAPAAFGVSGVSVTSVLPDSSTGTARLGQYAVTAGGRVSADVLEGLLRRLVER